MLHFSRFQTIAILASVLIGLLFAMPNVLPAAWQETMLKTIGAKSMTLGLDLQGGLEITKQAVPPKGRELTKEDLDRSVTIMRDRVDRLGVSEPEIRTQGDDQITIQLPGVKNPEAAAKIIGKTAQRNSIPGMADWMEAHSVSN